MTRAGTRLRTIDCEEFVTKKAAPSKRETPSTPARLNALVDLSHHNSHPDFCSAKADGIIGVIQHS